MPVTAVVGSQWGDEAKGKFVDLLASQADIVARFNGGDNAGHTVVNEFGTFKLRLTPNGFSNPKSICVIGPGVVVNSETLINEIKMLQESGIDLKDRLWISPRCHLVMPYHPVLETIFEKAKGKSRIGTTKRGIGPVYADKVSYNGVRFFDLANESVFSEKLQQQLGIKNPIIKTFGLAPLAYDEIYQQKLEQYAQLRDYIREPFGLIHETLERQGQILLEGAQGALLDNNWGSYPYCTASITLAGGAAAGLGIAPRWIDRVIAVSKAYTTRVGAGPMPTELHDNVGEIIQKEGQEYGTVTGRPRRCGWFDAELVRFSAQLNGATQLALTKLDVLDTLPNIKICVGYRQPGSSERSWRYWELDAIGLEACEPRYIEMQGWMRSTREIRQFTDLPLEAQEYVKVIEELVAVPVGYISVGPERGATIVIDG